MVLRGEEAQTLGARTEGLQAYGTQTFHVLSVNFGSAAVGRTELAPVRQKKWRSAVVGASLAL